MGGKGRAARNGCQAARVMTCAPLVASRRSQTALLLPAGREPCYTSDSSDGRRALPVTAPTFPRSFSVFAEVTGVASRDGAQHRPPLNTTTHVRFSPSPRDLAIPSAAHLDASGRRPCERARLRFIVEQSVELNYVQTLPGRAG